jgi:hypothetical protein
MPETRKPMNKVTATLVVLFFAVVVLIVVDVFRKMRTTRDMSAHSALTAEIQQKLSSIPPGQLYPTSLTQLQLTYPDGGSTSLLSRFTYTSTGTGCTVSTVLRGWAWSQSYP